MTKPNTNKSKVPGKRGPARKISPLASKGGTEAKGQRLQKILAAAGIASRRACEQIILDGRVQVNGQTIDVLGACACPIRDEITVDLVPIIKEKPVYILLNKPKGYVTTVKDTEGRPTVMALLNGVRERVYPVGRLDFNTEGLLLMTNDGTLALRLASPSSHIPKIYLAKVHKLPKPDALNELRSGFRLDGKRLKPCQIEMADRQDNPWYRITLVEGKNQQIRKMFAAIGHPIHKLKRIQFGPMSDPTLKPGQWRYLTQTEIQVLKDM
jgi:23S rRNA pseudouridine2605 synthase